MEDRSTQPLGSRLVERQIERKGLRPRLAAAVIAVLWLIAIVVFGIVEHLIDPDSFDSAWEGMWWATQTVTTVGYGDVVPRDAAGKLIATLLMVGGLSLFAVVTGTITSAFVTKAAQARGADTQGALEGKVDELIAEVTALREQIARLAPGDEPPTG